MADRTDLLAALARFHDAGLTPVVSTNGSIAGADIEVTRGLRVQGEKQAPILDVTVTAAGLARLILDSVLLARSLSTSNHRVGEMVVMRVPERFKP